MRKEIKVVPECPQVKRKPRAVSSFLKKTYELLNVLSTLSRMNRTKVLSDGPPMESDS